MSRNRKKPESRRSAWGTPVLGLGLALLAILGMVILLTPLGGKVKRGLKDVFGSETVVIEKEKPDSDRGAATPPDPLTPLESDPDPPFPRGVLTPPDGVDIRQLSKGIDLKVIFDSSDGELASIERTNRESYLAEYALRVRMPRAATSLEELTLTSPHLLEILPGLEAMLPKAEVSAWYRQIYANKSARLKDNVGRLDEVLSKHNFYDCETMLNLRSEESGQRLFLMQAEMDVVSDGSDGDRLARMQDGIVNSTNYQPFTSYRWKKSGSVPNPMIAGWERRIGKARREIGEADTGEERKAWLRKRIKMLEAGITDMKIASFLIAEYDPFIVIPINILADRRDPYAPNIGDFAILIHEGTVYPAIVGDAGPSFKVGEASLRLAREINASATPYSRPVSDLTVTYLVFPRSADDPKRAPDYGYWRKRCGELVDKVGGLGEGVELHEWKDLLPAE
ncbi:MAG: glycoside hydrolase family 75 protein [Roseibacillus sp.]|nr:glycoside hydrolase family 75 protein [Roseibacillus sp.]